MPLFGGSKYVGQKTFFRKKLNHFFGHNLLEFRVRNMHLHSFRFRNDRDELI